MLYMQTKKGRKIVSQELLGNACNSYTNSVASAFVLLLFEWYMGAKKYAPQKSSSDIFPM